MIGRLSGALVDKSPPTVVVDVHGVGYEVDVPMSTFYNLPAIGERVTLLTHFVVREDAQLLYGFLTARRTVAPFAKLVKISGVGPRTALAILSGLSVAELAQAVTRQDSARLVKVPGIGKKTAERLLLELKGKLGADLAGRAARRRSDAQADIAAGAAGAGLQRTRGAGGAEGAASRCRRQRRHQAGAEGAEPLNRRCAGAVVTRRCAARGGSATRPTMRLAGAVPASHRNPA